MNYKKPAATEIILKEYRFYKEFRLFLQSTYGNFDYDTLETGVSYVRFIKDIPGS